MSSSIRYQKDAILVTGKEENAFGVDITKDKRVMLDKNGLTLGNKENNVDVYVNEIEGNAIKLNDDKQASKTALPSSYAVMKAISEGGLDSLWPFSIETDFSDPSIPVLSIQYNQNDDKTQFLRYLLKYDMTDINKACVSTDCDARLTALAHFASMPVDKVRIFPYNDLNDSEKVAEMGLDDEEKVYLKRANQFVVAPRHGGTYAYKYVSGGSSYQDYEYEYCYYFDGSFYHTNDLTKDGTKFVYMNEVPEPVPSAYASSTPTASSPFKIDSGDERGVIQMKFTVGSEREPVTFLDSDLSNVLLSICKVNYSESGNKSKPYFEKYHTFDFDFKYATFANFTDSLTSLAKQAALAVKNISFTDKNGDVVLNGISQGSNDSFGFKDGQMVSDQSIVYMTFKDVENNNLIGIKNAARNRCYTPLKEIIDEMLKFKTVTITDMTSLFWLSASELITSRLFPSALNPADENIDLTNEKFIFPASAGDSIALEYSFGVSDVKTLKMPITLPKVTRARAFLYRTDKLESVTGIHAYDTSLCTDFYQAFWGTSLLKTLNVANWTFDNITGVSTNNTNIKQVFTVRVLEDLYIRRYNNNNVEQIQLLNSDGQDKGFNILAGATGSIIGVNTYGNITGVSSEEGYVKIATGDFTVGELPSGENPDDYILHVLHITITHE